MRREVMGINNENVQHNQKQEENLKLNELSKVSEHPAEKDSRKRDCSHIRSWWAGHIVASRYCGCGSGFACNFKCGTDSENEIIVCVKK